MPMAPEDQQAKSQPQGEAATATKEDAPQTTTPEKNEAGSEKSVQGDDPNVEDELTFQIRIDLPPAPAPELAVGEESDSNSKDQKKKSISSMTALCNATERVCELKNLVKELDGFWLGAFSFVRGAPNREEAQAQGQGAPEEEPFDDWTDMTTIFSGPEYEDSSVPKVLKVVPIPFDPLEIRSHILRANDIFHNTQTSLRSRQINRGPVFDPTALALDKGISYCSLFRDNSTDASGVDGNDPQILRAQRDAPLDSLVKLRQQLAAVPPASPCVKSFALSPYNPPSQANRLRGHLVYLDLVTIENKTLHIVGMTTGFYLCDPNVSPPAFKPKATTTTTTTSKPYPSLFSILADRSPAFLAAIKDVFPPEPVLNPDNLTAVEAHPLHLAAPWLALPPQPKPDLLRTQLSFLLADHTVPDHTPYERNWNQEFVLMKDLPRRTIGERVNRERFLARLQSDMADFAAKTVAGIVHGDISVANPNDPPAMQTLVHHNLLFVPSKDALEAFGHLGGDEAVRVTSGKDVKNATTLSNADIEGLHLSPSVCVDYMGQRWFCQSLTPGLLSSDNDVWTPQGKNLDQDVVGSDAQQQERSAAVGSQTSSSEAKGATLKSSDEKSEETKADSQTSDVLANPPVSSSTLKILYGSVDTDHPERAYAAEPSFEPLAKTVADLFHLDKHDVHDVEGRATSLWLSGEVKGVLGQDNNKYLLDLYRLQPVDVNFLRTETLSQLFSNPYQSSPSPESSSNADTAYPHRLVLLRPELLKLFRQNHAKVVQKHFDVKTEEGSPAPAPAKQVLTCCQPSAHSEEELLKSIRFNPDAFVERLNEAGGVPVDEKDASTQHVQMAADFLITQAIPRAVQHLARPSTFPYDGAHLTATLHHQGINMRYLGRLASKCKLEEAQPLSGYLEGCGESQLKALARALEQEMVFRATKHILRRRLEPLDLLQVPSFLSHFLNCLLGASYNPTPEADLSSIPPSPQGAQPSPSWTELTPAAVQAEVTSEVARRFRYTLSADWFDTQMRPAQLLREICLRCGFQLRLRSFTFQKGSVSPPAKQLEKPSQPPASAKGKGKGKAAKKPTAPAQLPASLASSAEVYATTFVPDDFLQLYPTVKGMQHRSWVSDAFDAYILKAHVEEEKNGFADDTGLSHVLHLAEQIYGLVHAETARMYHEMGSYYHGALNTTRDELWHHDRAHITGKAEVTLANGATEPTWTEEQRLQAKQRLLQLSHAALTMQRQAVVLGERVHGTYTPETAERLHTLGLLEGVWGHHEHSVEYLYRAREILDIVCGPNHPSSRDVTVQLSNMALRRFGGELATSVLEEGLEIARESEGLDSATYAILLMSRAASKVQVRSAITQETVEELQEAHDRLRKIYNAENRHLMEAQIALLSAKQLLVDQSAREQERVAGIVKRLGVSERRAKEIAEKNKGQSAEQQLAEARASGMRPSKPGLADMPIDYLVDFIDGGSATPSAPGRSSGKSKSRKKKH